MAQKKKQEIQSVATETALQFKPNTEAAALSKLQIKFNKLTARIESKQRSIADLQANIDYFRTAQSVELAPMNAKKTEHESLIALALSKVAARYKLGKRQKESVFLLIVALLDSVFAVRPATDEEKQLYDLYSDSTFDEEMERQHDGTIEMLVYMFKEATGHEIPKDARANMDTMNAWMETEGVKFIIEAKEAAQKESEAASSLHNQKNEPKKTKKQIEKEERLRAAEAEKTKTIRSIYLSLAKVLHPDTELDENEKHQKEALMKRVTVAYQENNLQELLKLELEWIHQQSIGMEHIAENKLKIYVEVLEEQARNLDHEYVQMTRTPDLASYSYYLTKPKASVETFLNRKKKELSVLLTFLGSYNSFLVEVDSKQMFMSLVGQLLVHYEPQDDFMSELDFIFR